jgi:hypothetical protein
LKRSTNSWVTSPRAVAVRAFRTATLSILVFASLVETPAGAQSPGPQETAQQHYDRGAKLYNLGHFQEAIPDFEKAYDLDPSPIFLFNIAQSHRQLGNKERALFFYRRYLEQAPKATNRDDVERRMKDLEASLQQEAELKQKPPTEVEGKMSEGKVADGKVSVTPGPAQTTTTPLVSTPVAAVSGAPSWSVGAYLAPAFLSMSGSSTNLPAIFAVRIESAYAFHLPSAALRVGLDLGFAQLPYTNVQTPGSGTSSFWTALLTARYLRDLSPNLKVGGGLGVGVVWWAGLDAGNPFTVDQVAASGAIPMPSFQVGARGEYRFDSGLFIALAPELLFSKTTSDGLSQSVSAVTRFDLIGGVGYSF